MHATFISQLPTWEREQVHSDGGLEVRRKDESVGSIVKEKKISP